MRDQLNDFLQEKKELLLDKLRTCEFRSLRDLCRDADAYILDNEGVIGTLLILLMFQTPGWNRLLKYRPRLRPRPTTN